MMLDKNISNVNLAWKAIKIRTEETNPAAVKNLVHLTSKMGFLTAECKPLIPNAYKDDKLKVYPDQFKQKNDSLIRRLTKIVPDGDMDFEMYNS